MGGFFGTVAKATSCVADLFYGTDYNSHLGTKRGGLATYDAENELFTRSIHNLESTYFRTKFEDELDKFKGNSGIGIISDTDPQPLILNSHLGSFAIVTVAKIMNLQELEDELLSQNMHFGELSSGKTNQTELIALLLIQGKNFVEGIENVYKHIHNPSLYLSGINHGYTQTNWLMDFKNTCYFSHRHFLKQYLSHHSGRRH